MRNDRDQRREQHEPGARVAVARSALGRRQDVLLGPEADERRDARQRQQAEEHRGPDEQVAAHAAPQGGRRGAADGDRQPPDGEEEQRLEEGVRGEVQHPGARALVGRGDRQRGEHEGDLAEGGVGEQPLEVALPEGQQRGPHHRHRGAHGEQPPGAVARDQQVEQLRQHEGAGRHHRRRVDQRGRRASGPPWRRAASRGTAPCPTCRARRGRAAPWASVAGSAGGIRVRPHGVCRGAGVRAARATTPRTKPTSARRVTRKALVAARRADSLRLQWPMSR